MEKHDNYYSVNHYFAEAPAASKFTGIAADILCPDRHGLGTGYIQ